MFRNTFACFALLSSSLYAMEPSFKVQVDKDASHMICRVTFREGDTSNIKLSYLWLTSLNNHKNDFYGEYPRNQLREGDNTLARVTPLNLKKVGEYNWTKCQVTALDRKGNSYTQISPAAKVVRITEDEPVHFIPNSDTSPYGIGHSLGVLRGNVVYLFDIQNITKSHSLLPLLKTELPKKLTEVYETSSKSPVVSGDNVEHFHFALLTDGSLFGWGKSIYNAMGEGQTTGSKYFPVPTQIHLPGKVTSFIPAHHGVLENVAILKDGSLFHWGVIDPKEGNNCKKWDYCPLTVEPLLPLFLPLKNLKQVIFNSRRQYFLTRTGELLGDWYELPNHPPFRGYPADLWQGPSPLMNTVEAFYPYAWNEDESRGYQYNFYLTSQGELWSAGETYYHAGSIALGTERPFYDRVLYYNSPLRLDFPAPVLKMFYDSSSFGGYSEHHGYDFTCIPHFAELRDGQTYAWGCNFRGDLGVGRTGVVPHPTQVLLPGPIDKLYFSQTNDDTTKNVYKTLFAILQNGDLYAWGNNSHNKLGLGTLVQSISVPERIILPQKVISFVSDNEDDSAPDLKKKNSRNFATLADGSVYMWGIFNNKSFDVPTKLNLKVKQLLVGQGTDLVLSTEGKLYNLNLGIPEALNHPLAFKQKVEQAEIEYFGEKSGSDSFVLARLEDNSLYAIDLNRLENPAIKILDPLNTLDVLEN